MEMLGVGCSFPTMRRGAGQKEGPHQQSPAMTLEEAVLQLRLVKGGVYLCMLACIHAGKCVSLCSEHDGAHHQEDEVMLGDMGRGRNGSGPVYCFAGQERRKWLFK